MSRYAVTQLDAIDPVPCPCGQTRRAFVDDPDQTASLHLVEVSSDSRAHYHKRLTEIYYVVEGAGEIELDGERFPLRVGTSVLIKPGVRHRAIPAADATAPLRLINMPVPAFDPDDEWFD
ncbi:Cupin domain protein [Botrimarina colliarenosi]|uniref:Cupin domain protein n=1 Tax=Botrimarina colliarenosi TaxID=2528001 RepID=A0A5C6AEP2_9BACT|nr:cupin domain-containing protein [Botrimarina colliarenosi]TWT97887.1 Cupin domain protein [Botrimarina colliarenosi]